MPKLSDLPAWARDLLRDAPLYSLRDLLAKRGIAAHPYDVRDWLRTGTLHGVAVPVIKTHGRPAHLSTAAAVAEFVERARAAARAKGARDPFRRLEAARDA